LAAAGRSVLLVDMDPQGNATSGLGIAKNEVELGSYEILIGAVPAEAAILPTEIAQLKVIPSNRELAGASIELVDLEEREFRLRQALDPLRERFDYLLIDCPPSLELLTVNALVAADTVLVPLQCEYFALEGISDLMNTLELVRAGLNPKLAVEGILLTMFDARNNLAHQVKEEVTQYFKEQVFEMIVPRNVRLSEAPSHGKPILLYDLASRGSQAYLSLAEAIITRDSIASSEEAEQAGALEGEDEDTREPKNAEEASV